MTIRENSGRETLESGLVSKLQRLINLQQKLWIVFHLLSFQFMTIFFYPSACAWRLLAIQNPWEPFLSLFYILKHHRLPYINL